MDATATEPKTPLPADPAAATAATGELPPATADGEKKEGEGAGEEDEDKVKPLYEKYDWFDPRKFTPICTLSIKLIQPQW